MPPACEHVCERCSPRIYCSKKFELVGGSPWAHPTAKTKLDAIFKALASEHRREILRMLGESTPEPGKTCCAADEMCACKLSDQPRALGVHDLAPHVRAARRPGWSTRARTDSGRTTRCGATCSRAAARGTASGSSEPQACRARCFARQFEDPTTTSTRRTT